MEGFINVLKPPGMSSGAAVAMVKRLTGMKVGHCGTLDPEASGILPIMVGRATRLFDFMVEKEKTYLAEVAFGYATDTQDAQGVAIAAGEKYPALEAVKLAAQKLTGDILQKPPIYSALKRDGEPLYKLALKGKLPEIEARPIHVERIDVICETPRHGFMIRVVCGRGTYIRTICHDMGEMLGCPAHMRFLLREQTGPFGLDTAVTIEQLKAAKEDGTIQQYVLPMDYPLSHMPKMSVEGWTQRLIENGVTLRQNQWPGHIAAGEHTRVYAGNQFMGISRAEADGTLVPRVVLNRQEGRNTNV